MVIRILTALLLMSALAAGPALAQSAVLATVESVCTFWSGNLVNVRVVIDGNARADNFKFTFRNSATNQEHVFPQVIVTPEPGLQRFFLVPPGTYTLEVTSPHNSYFAGWTNVVAKPVMSQTVGGQPVCREGLPPAATGAPPARR